MNMVLRVRASHVSRVRTNRFDNSFFPSTSKSWDDLDDEAKAKPSPVCFKDYLNTNYIRPVSKKTFTNYDTQGISILTKIRVEFSDLRDHRYNHNFNCISPTCKCTRDRETSVNYFLCCPLYEQIVLYSLAKYLISSTLMSVSFLMTIYFISYYMVAICIISLLINVS